MTGPANKTSSGPLLWITVALLAVGGGGAYYFLTQNQASVETEQPVQPTPPGGQVQLGKPLVVKELPFLTTSNRTVVVENNPQEATGRGPSNRTSNPFIPVVLPQAANTGSTSSNTSTTTFSPPAIEVNSSTKYIPPSTNNINQGGDVVVLPGTNLPIPNVGTNNNNLGGTNNNNLGGTNNNNNLGGTNNNTIKPPRAAPLPVPSVVQPKAGSTATVPEQKSTIISAPTPVLISSLVVPSNKTTTPETPVAESVLLKTSTALQLAFSSVVIGPNSTAVFNSNKGFLMASTGQKLAGTDILVKSISQQQVTLQLGDETLELTLDRR